MHAATTWRPQPKLDLMGTEPGLSPRQFRSGEVETIAIAVPLRQNTRRLQGARAPRDARSAAGGEKSARRGGSGRAAERRDRARSAKALRPYSFRLGPRRPPAWPLPTTNPACPSTTRPWPGDRRNWNGGLVGLIGFGDRRQLKPAPSGVGTHYRRHAAHLARDCLAHRPSTVGLEVGPKSKSNDFFFENIEKWR